MSTLSKSFKYLKRVNFKTLYFNFKYLSFRQAIILPVFISRHVYLRKMEGEVKIEGILKPGLIQIGYGKVGIFDNKRSRSIWEVSGVVVFKGRASIGHGSKISVNEGGVLLIGKDFKVSAETSLVVWRGVEFGNNCLISWDTLIIDTDLHNIKNEDGKVINEPRKIYVGDNVWIGCRCLIMKGSHIPNNSIIAANTYVSKKLNGEKQIFGGNPVRVLKESVLWEHEK